MVYSWIMKKPRNYYFYTILGLPVSIVIFLTNTFEWSGMFNIYAGFIMILYCMYTYFRPDKKKDISSLASSFFLSAAFVLLSTFFLSLPFWIISLGFR